jgi:hypothetical protein
VSGSRVRSNEAQTEELEYRLVPCGTETGELESENWVGIPR